MTDQKLAVGICTYKRPEKLKKCLSSLLVAKTPNDISTCIIIADNDPNGSAKSIVDIHKGNSILPIHYSIITQQGIPFARNHILRQADSLDITELAFIDDDEYVSTEWLIKLWHFYNTSDADVAYGQVITVYPKNTPQWIYEGKFYQRPSHPTGTQLLSAATNNVLFDFNKIVRQLGIYFDESFGLRGGSDTDFFVRARHNGAVIKFVNDAIVSEPLDKKRFTLRYFLRRSFRKKNHVSRYKHYDYRQKIVFVTVSAYYITRGLLTVLCMGLFNRGIFYKGLMFLAYGAGSVCSIFGIQIKWDEYC